MAKFTYDESLANERIKRLQTITAPITISFGDLEALRDAVEAWPETYEVEVTKVVASSETAELDVRYTARGANRTDITRRLDETGIRYVIAKTKTKTLEGGDTE